MKVLITGGASGLGAAITREVFGLGNQNIVYFTYNNSEIKAKELSAEFSNCKAIKCDFTNEMDLLSLLSLIEDEKIDVLVNNAYCKVFETKYFHKTDFNNYSDSFLSNLIPTIRISQKAIQVFRQKKFGKVITVLSSSVINRPPVGWSLYVAEKNYLLSLSKSWAIENAKFNISSNSISPAFMATDFHKETDERVIDEIILQHPLKKLLEPKDVAKYVVYLIQSSQHINGTNMLINAAQDVI